MLPLRKRAENIVRAIYHRSHEDGISPLHMNKSYLIFTRPKNVKGSPTEGPIQFLLTKANRKLALGYVKQGYHFRFLPSASLVNNTILAGLDLTNPENNLENLIVLFDQLAPQRKVKTKFAFKIGSGVRAEPLH